MKWGTATLMLTLVLTGALPGFQTGSGGTDATQRDAVKPVLAAVRGRLVDFISGAPVKKAKVTLIGIGTVSSTVATDTDEQGGFSFRDLPAGQYLLSAQRVGYASQQYGARPKSLRGTPLSLSAGEELANLEFRLWPNSVVSGRVVNDEGEPVANATVVATRAVYRRGKRQHLPLGAAQTNDRGEYRIASLREGHYFLFASFRDLLTGLVSKSSGSLPGQPELAYTTTWYPNSSWPSDAVAVEVGPGAELSGLDILIAKATTYRVRGKLGSSLKGQRVIVTLTPKGEGLTGFITRAVASVQSDGSFELRGIAPGSYLLAATSQDGLSTVSALQPIDVLDQHVDGAVLESSNWGELSVSVGMEGELGAGLKAVQLVLNPLDITDLNPPKASIDDEGRWTFRNVSPQRYEVRVDGAEGLFVKSVKYRGAELTEEGLDLTGGGTGQVQVVLSAKGAHIAGTVRGQDHKPVCGATAVLIPDLRRSSLFMEASTDQNGQFVFKGVRPGSYKVIAWEDLDSGAYYDADVLKAGESKAISISVTENDRKTLSLEAIKSGT